MVIGGLAGAATGAAIGNAIQAQEEANQTQDEAIERQQQLIRAQAAELEELRRLSQDSVSYRGSEDNVGGVGSVGSVGGGVGWMVAVSVVGALLVREGVLHLRLVRPPAQPFLALLDMAGNAPSKALARLRSVISLAAAADSRATA